MAQNKAKIKENDENGILGASKKRSTAEINHWAFLDEIEAPMWADLALEPKLVAEDNDDAWFHTSHPFHQLSARQLRSAFAHPDVENDFINFTLQGPCSPKLPSSVSKSRGKDYVGRPQRNNDWISVSKTHPVNDLGGRKSRLDIGSSQECKATGSFVPKSEVSSSVTSVLTNDSHAGGRNSRLDIGSCQECKAPASFLPKSEVSSSVISVLSNDSHAVTVSCNSKAVVDDADACGALNAQSSFSSAVSTSTITSVSQQQHLKYLEVSKEAFGQTGGLLNSLKANLRKSYATRKASRVAVHDSRGQTGRKSSASNTSVDSSSVGYEGTGKRSSVLSKTDHSKQVNVDTNVNIKLPVSRADIREGTKAKDRKSSAGKSSMSSSSIGDHGKGKLSSVLPEKEHKSSAGKSSVGSSSIGKYGEGKISSVLPQTYLRKQAKVEMNVNRKGNCHNSSTQVSNVGISISRPEAKKLAAGSNQNKDRNSSFRGPEKSAQPPKGRVNANKVSETLVKKMTAGLKQSRPRDSKLLRKSAAPIKVGAKAQQLVELSANVRTVINSRLDSRIAAAASLKPAKSKVPLQKSSTNRPRVEAAEVKGKVGHSRRNGTACSEKENMRGILSSEKYDANNNVPVVKVSDQKRLILKVENKGSAALVRSKVKIGRVDNNKLSSDVRVHLR